LLRLVDAPRHVHFDPAGGLDGDFLEIRSGRFAQGPALFEIGDEEEQAERNQPDHHDGRDDLVLETVGPTPESHGSLVLLGHHTVRNGMPPVAESGGLSLG
jgi:hypothetical protein